MHQRCASRGSRIDEYQSHNASAGAAPDSGAVAPAKLDHRAVQGKIRHPGELQIAFGIVAVMTVIAAAVAIISLRTERDSSRWRHQVPMMTDAMRLRDSARSRPRRTFRQRQNARIRKRSPR